MSVEASHPSNLADLAEMAGLVSQVQWHTLKTVWRGSSSYTLRAEGRIIALAGYYRMPEGGFEAWFQFARPAGKHLLGVIRAVRLTLASGAYSGTVTLCVTDEGKRFAALCGFIFVTRSPLGEVWAHDDGHTDWKRRAKRYGNKAGQTATDRPAARSEPAISAG